jgi:hypothetical protein
MTDSTPSDTMTQYLAFWNAQTLSDQQHLAEETFTRDVHYYAPIGVLAGTDALITFRDQFVDHVGPMRFQARSQPEAHNGRMRLQWDIRLADGESFATGTDVMVLEPDGRISSITAYLDQAPAGVDPHTHS